MRNDRFENFNRQRDIPLLRPHLTDEEATFSARKETWAPLRRPSP